MDKTLNQEDIKNLLVMLQRVDLKGNEAMAVATLQVKLSNMVEKVEEVINDKPAGKTKN
jgi:hypothetical protein